MHTISRLVGREVLDSRGNPTLEVEVYLKDGAWGRAMVPSGASKGQHEALELRDGDRSRFLGKGVQKTVTIISDKLSPILTGQSVATVMDLDDKLIRVDGTPQKSALGANSLLGVSLAFSHAVAASRKEPLYRVLNEWMGLKDGDLRLPVPLMNILNGGVHANNGLEIQEFMIVPHGFSTFKEALRAGCEVFQHLKERLHDQHLSTAVGDEGGFAPVLASNEAALEMICGAIEKAGYKLGRQISLALDVASSSFYNADKGNYAIRFKGKTSLGREELIGFYQDLAEKFPLVSVEDALEEDDWTGWKELTRKMGEKLQLVGDDLFVTQPARVRKGIQEGVGNAVLIKVNQIGSLKETFETMELCRGYNYRAVVSHRSGETEDVTIAHLAVGSGCGQIKTGSVSRSERTAKYNELLRIEEQSRSAGRPIPFARVFG